MPGGDGMCAYTCVGGEVLVGWPGAVSSTTQLKNSAWPRADGAKFIPVE